MKKLLITALMLGSAVFVVPSAQAKTTTALTAGEPQINVRIGPQRRRWNNRRVRTVTRTRIVRIGRSTYREVYRITYLPNGRTRTQVISRTRIRRY
jgi:hypothetical protein